METAITTSIYAWMAFCAVSHVRIEAKKRNETMSFASHKWECLIQVLVYWALTSVIF
jgi:hypothetical protein